MDKHNDEAKCAYLGSEIKADKSTGSYEVDGVSCKSACRPTAAYATGMGKAEGTNYEEICQPYVIGF